MFNVSKYPSKPMLVKQSGSPLLADHDLSLQSLQSADTKLPKLRGGIYRRSHFVTPSEPA